MEQTIKELVEIIRRTTTGKCAIALAGAHAKGMADAASDIDLYVYAEGAKPYEERLAIIRSAADPGTEPWVDLSFDATPWGGSMDFQYQGIPVEVSARTLEYTNGVVEDALEGKFQIIPATWTSNGYYTFIHLSELSFVKPIYDPEGVLAALKEKAAVYPPKLREAVCRTFLDRAGMWLYNFHYDSAIKRGDLLFCGPIVQHTILDLIQVIFALNRQYFTGDKKLEKALGSLPWCPPALLQNLQFLLTPFREEEPLTKQRDLLRQIYGEVKEKI